MDSRPGFAWLLLIASLEFLAGAGPLLKLFAKLRELLFQLRDLILQRCNLGLQPRDRGAVRRETRGDFAHRLALLFPLRILHVPAKQMRIARLLSPRLSRQ